MQDTSLTPNTTDRPQTGEEPGKLLAPLWMFKIMNPIMSPKCFQVNDAAHA